MLKRAYCSDYHKSFPSYSSVSVYDGWFLFSSFKAWMEHQDWVGKELDKDLLSTTNKIYSPDTCCFITKQLNMFMTESTATRGEWPIGVCFVEKVGKYRSQCCNPFTKRQETVGMFLTPVEAHNAWRERKFVYASMLASEQTDPRIADAILEKYRNY